MLEFWFPLGCVKPTCGSSEGCGHVADAELRPKRSLKLASASQSNPVGMAEMLTGTCMFNAR